MEALLRVTVASLLFSILINSAMGGEIVNVTLDNWNELMTGKDLGVVLIVSSSWEYLWGGMVNFYDYEAMANLFDNDSNHMNRLVGFVSCRTDERLCKEMGITSNPAVRFGRPKSLEEFSDFASPEEARLIPAFVDTAMEYQINPAFSPSSLDISADLPLAELSLDRTVLARYCVPRSGECRRSQPDWERLAKEHNHDESNVLVAEVDCSSDTLHKEHERSCSWSDRVNYARGGYKTNLRPKESWNRSSTLRPALQYDDLASVVEELGSADPIPLTNSTWDASIHAKPGRNVFVLFTKPRCCSLSKDAAYGSNESISCFQVGGFEQDSNAEADYSVWYEGFPDACQRAQLEMVRLANRCKNGPNHLIATVDCEQEQELCERLPIYTDNLPMIMYGKVPDLSFSDPFGYPYDGITLDTTGFHIVYPTGLELSCMGKPANETNPDDSGMPAWVWGVLLVCAICVVACVVVVGVSRFARKASSTGSHEKDKESNVTADVSQTPVSGTESSESK